MALVIQGGHILDPGRFNAVGDLLIDHGKIVAIGSDVKIPAGATIYAAKGHLVVPGFVDLHVHFREPGFEYKETIASGAASAVAGGFTTVCCMPNTNPVNDNQAITEFMCERARAAGLANVLPIGAITKGSEGKELAEIGDLRRAGCVAISDDGKPVMNSLVMRRAMEYALAFDIPVVDHCEDLHLAEGGCMNEGLISTELGLPGIPAAAEDVMVARNVSLAELTGARLHLAHISTAGSVRMVREAKSRGIKVTAEACPHHFTLTEEVVRGFNTLAKMNPPLRTWQDVQAIKDGLRDGTIDVIATDHAPHASQEKQQGFTEAPFGIVGLETAVSLVFDQLVHRAVITPARMVELMSVNPADILGVPGGSLGEGVPADITLLAPDVEVTIDPARFRSRSRNTPFGGRALRGAVAATIVGGRLVHVNDAVAGTAALAAAWAAPEGGR